MKQRAVAQQPSRQLGCKVTVVLSKVGLHNHARRMVPAAGPKPVARQRLALGVHLPPNAAA